MPEVPAWFTDPLREQNLSNQQLLQLYKHYELLIQWNRKMNLTSLRPGSEMVLRHYAESLFFGAHLPVTADSIADIGSGAGFPGVPIAVQRPSSKVTLIESNQRKAVFLKEATRELSNVTVLAKRAEDVGSVFDWIVTRAVDPSTVLDLVPRLSAQVGLMLGQDDIPVVKKRSDIAWSEPIRLPWGDHRVCLYGEVPRGTFHVEP